MVARQVANRELVAAVQAQVRIASKQRLVVQRGHVTVHEVRHIGRPSHCSDDGIDLDGALLLVTGVMPTVQTEERRPAAVGDLAQVVQADGVAVIDPLKWHASHISPEDLLGGIADFFV